MDHAPGHHAILTTNRYTHLTRQTEALATQRIDALMGRFNLGWGAVYRDFQISQAVVFVFLP